MRPKTEPMTRLAAGWRIQTRVISALMIRELSTRFGRENIGFLWVMVEPLMFAILVGVIWRAWKGPEEYGIDIVAFVVTGYIPLTLFRQAISRSVGAMKVNGSLMYHRQIKILDLVLVRFLVEMIGGMMAYVFIGAVLIAAGVFPIPSDLGMLIGGWLLYSFFTFSVCLVVSPLSEMSEVIEKMVPVTTYVMVPFSGVFTLSSWVTPKARDFLYYSPPVSAMEMMRHGLFGNLVRPYYNLTVPLIFSVIMTIIGLVLCRRIRRILVVE
jgi:capsular polysaccharide transport system permease protein